ncbi:hypothetical protein [Frankia sp. R82]|uniref:hypothetical protein n=1 Tax=Frankia sp. R82 TaxID=2950553 RepID=UPI002044405B|nr:hypothetical protein [Frankia sp. R82]MCM3883865.1 hypothetical protein [Frankia sp. R82]
MLLAVAAGCNERRSGIGGRRIQLVTCETVIDQLKVAQSIFSLGDPTGVVTGGIRLPAERAKTRNLDR